MKLIGITLGPIFDVIEPMRKTRSIFAASFVFSFIMREILNYLKAHNFNGEILFPYTENEQIYTEPQGAGIFPDTMIAIAQEGDFDKLKEARLMALYALSKILHNIPAKAIFDNLQMYCCEIEVDNLKDGYKEIRKVLSAMEKRKKIINREVFLTELAKANDALLTKALGGNTVKFPEIRQICTVPIQSKEVIYSEAYYQENKDRLRLHHKYIAVVQADGDGLSSFLEGLKNDKEKIKALSAELIDFDIEAINEVKEYGGIPIYLGGDDLLFFAPVIGKRQMSIFELLNKIDEKFAKIQSFSEMDKKPTMSYGVSITYHKFPLNESLDLAYHYLKEAKNNGKNRIVLKIPEHRVEINLEKAGNAYHTHVKNGELFKIFGIGHNNNDNQNEFLKSIVSFVQENLGLFEYLMNEKIIENPAMLKSYFDNEKNEAIHLGNETFEKIADYIYYTLEFANANNKTNLASVMQFLHFVNRKFEKKNIEN